MDWRLRRWRLWFLPLSNAPQKFQRNIFKAALSPQSFTLLIVHSKNNPPFWGMPYLFFGYETEIGVVRILDFFNVDLCSATSVESSRRDLLNDTTERKHIL